MAMIKPRDKERIIRYNIQIFDLDQRLQDMQVERLNGGRNSLVSYRAILHQKEKLESALARLQRTTAKHMTRHEVYSMILAEKKNAIDERLAEIRNIEARLSELTSSFIIAGELERVRIKSDIRAYGRELLNKNTGLRNMESGLSKWLETPPARISVPRTIKKSMDEANYALLEGFSDKPYFSRAVVNSTSYEEDSEDKPAEEFDITTLPDYMQEIARTALKYKDLSKEDKETTIKNIQAQPKLATESGFALLGVKPDYNVQLLVKPNMAGSITNEVEEQAPKSAGENK